MCKIQKRKEKYGATQHSEVIEAKNKQKKKNRLGETGKMCETHEKIEIELLF